MKPGQDELLRPTLSADYDVRAYRPLFRPESILYPSFFGGPFAALVLFGTNYARMGRRDLARNAWIAGAVLTVVLGVAVAWILAESWAESGTRRTPTGVRLALNGLGVAIGWFLSKHQASRFEAWHNAGNAPAKLLWPGLAAVIAGAIAMGSVVVGALFFLGAFA